MAGSALSCAALAILLAAGASAADGIGSVGAVNPLTTGEQPAATARQLLVADRVVAEERIVAGENGLAQLMFADQSTLTVGPNSEVVLDRFVYDPAADTGEVALTLARGALRFIGGRTTKSADARIATPSGLIGLRGGMIHVEVGPVVTRVILLAGEYAVVRAAGRELALSRPGAFALIETQPGAEPTLSFGGVLSPAEAAQALAAFSSSGDGGARAIAAAETPGTAMAAGAPQAGIVSTLGERALSATPALAAVDGRVIEVQTQTVAFSEPGRVVADSVGFVDVGTTGELRGQLQWRDAADLDLRMIAPASAVLPGSGREVSLDMPELVLRGGAVARLDGDATGEVPTLAPDLRIENIAVTEGLAPPGVYAFIVQGSVLPAGGTDYRLVVTPDGGRTVLTDAARLVDSPGQPNGVPTATALEVTVGEAQ